MKDFEDLSKYVEDHTTDELLLISLRNQGFYSCKMEHLSSVQQMIVALNESTLGKYTIILGDTIQAEVTDIKENFDKYKTLYHEMLEDDKSKSVLFHILAYRLTRLEKYILDAFCFDSEQYFDPMVALYKKDCIYADCGALDGYTTAQFMLHCPSYKKIYLYEPMECYYYDCIKNIKGFKVDNIVLRQAAVFDQNTMLTFDANVSGNSKVDENGDILVAAIRLDEDIKEPLGFIKMDIEGSEKAAIKGAEQHIRNDNAMLAICVYHLPSDLWEIPYMIQKINSNYRFCLRHHQTNTDETVCYAIPKKCDAVSSSNPGALSYETETACHRVISKIQKAEMLKLLQSKIYLLQQVDNYQYSTKQLTDSIKELQDWTEQLEEAKTYFEEQIKNRDGSISELQSWTGKLEEAKKYLTQELSIRDEKLDSLTNTIEEQQQTIEELTAETKRLTFYLREEINKPWHKKLVNKSKESDYKLH